MSYWEDFDMAPKKDKNESRVSVNVNGMKSKFANLKVGKKGDSKKELQLSNNKNGISNQIQSKIGKSVILVLIVVALIATIMVNNIVTESNDKELKLESQVAAYQLAEFFAPYETMTDQLAVNAELQLVLSNN